MGRREEAKNHRRQRIIAAARSLMIDGGEAGFSMRALAKTAGVSIATPYNLFGSKQAILGSVFEHDLANYQCELRQLSSDALELLFNAVDIAAELLGQEPEFYSAVLSLTNERGPEGLPFNNGPRHCMWRDMIKAAIAAGHLIPTTDADALAINLRYGFLASITRWAVGKLTLEEMTARAKYGFALSLAAMSTAGSREWLQRKIQSTQSNLQTIWHERLRKKMNQGDLNKESAALAADQLILMRKQEARYDNYNVATFHAT